MTRLEQNPRKAKIARVEFLQENLFGVSVTFHMRNADIEERFLLYEPWPAWNLAQLMQLCKGATTLQELVGQNVKLFLSTGLDGTNVAAIFDEKSNTVYPFHPYGTFFMKSYSKGQFFDEWYAH